MIKYALSILLVLFLGGCTISPPRDIPFSYASECASIECVVDAVDALRDKEEYGGDRWKIMEGYKDTYLKQMLLDGRLTIQEINPLYVPLGLLGYARMYHGLYGEVWKCDVWYLPWGNYFLVHELLHCQGYRDRGPLSSSDQYAHEQQIIMQREGKSRWTDTEFYKNKRYITEDYIFTEVK